MFNGSPVEWTPPRPELPIGEPYPLWPGEKSGIPEELWNMKAVLNQHKIHDSTPAQMVMRKSLEDDVGRFMGMLHAAGESYQKNLRKGMGGEGMEEVDMGTAAALKIINGLIDEWEEQEAKRKKAAAEVFFATEQLHAIQNATTGNS